MKKMDSNICIRCDGEGRETFWDDRWENDICYHCAGTGKVDDEIAFADSLSAVAKNLAYHTVDRIRAARNSDPSGEGWDFCAAENMMTGSDYFLAVMENYVAEYMNRLLEMDRQQQEVLVAWNALPVTTKQEKEIASTPVNTYIPSIDWSNYYDDGILF